MEWIYATNERNCMEELKEFVDSKGCISKGNIFGRNEILQVLRQSFLQRGLIKHSDILQMSRYIPKHRTNLNGLLRLFSTALEIARKRRYIEHFAFDSALQ